MTVVMLIDFQRAMCDDDGVVGRHGLAQQITQTGTLENASAALKAAREAGYDVVHVRLAFAPGFVNRTNRTARFDDHETAGRFLLGTAETEFRSEVAPTPTEQQIAKGSVSPFASTPLLAQLHARGQTDLVVCGVATHLAVESAAREAADRGLRVTVLADACAAPSQELHRSAIETTIPSFATVLNTSGFVKSIAASSDKEQSR
jgi:biuret amidohydrolase